MAVPRRAWVTLENRMASLGYVIEDTGGHCEVFVGRSDANHVLVIYGLEGGLPQANRSAYWGWYECPIGGTRGGEAERFGEISWPLWADYRPETLAGRMGLVKT